MCSFPLKVWVLSDLHIDFCAMTVVPPAEGFDVVVIPGDIMNGWKDSLTWLQTTFIPLGRPIIYVPGNHDFYGGRLSDVHAMQSMATDLGIELLHNGQSIVINGARFLGATLWTDYLIAGSRNEAMTWAMNSMPDMKHIRGTSNAVTAMDLLEEHEFQLNAIVEALKVPFSGVTVVVSHHAPHSRSLSGGTATDPDDGSFASDLEWVIRQFSPEFWIHGHVHHYCYYEIGETQILCNPRGYQTVDGHAENDLFDPHLVIDV